MKVCIAGSRSITDYNIVKKAIKDSGFKISEVVSGGANGVDKLGERYAKENNIPLKQFLPDWNNINGPDVVIKYHNSGKPYNAISGLVRNEKMAEYCDAGIAICKDESKGTSHMISCLKELSKPCYVVKI